MKNKKLHITLPNSTPSEELYRFGADGNLRLYSYDRLFFAVYGYDGGTTRTYKYSFDLNPNWVNGRLEAVNFNPHTAMFYPNSYLNFNQDGYYTKHYYNGMERIASRLGDQNISINVNDPDLQDRKWQLDSNIRRNIVGITGYEFLPVGEEQNPDDPKPIFELPQVGLNNLIPNTSAIYYYHPNHLGSTCYVTDENASVQQGFLYAPFGEITNEHSPMWQNGNIPKYAFNAKELDEETGMYYYEARYYAPPVFTSRDPLFEKYPTFSPYAYCANNPIMFIDPDGRDWFENELTGEVFYNSHMGKKDAGKESMTGAGWKWMGKNDMFGKVDAAFIDDNSEFLYSNGAQLSGYTMQTLNDGLVGVDEMRFGGNSEAFMSKMGYERKPLTAIVDVVEYVQIMDNDINGAPRYYVDRHDVSPIKILTSTYLKKNIPYSYEIIDKTKPYDRNLGPLIRETTWSETRKYNYGKSDLRSLIKPGATILELIKDFISVFFNK